MFKPMSTQDHTTSHRGACCTDIMAGGKPLSLPTTKSIMVMGL